MSATISSNKRTMKKRTLVLFTLLAAASTFGQTGQPEATNKGQYNCFTGAYDMPGTLPTKRIKENNFKAPPFDADCATDFWTTSSSGALQRWSLASGIISGGDTVLMDCGTSIAYCGNPNDRTFYATDYPDSEILYVDNSNNWVSIPTTEGYINNGGHNADQYYMGVNQTSNFTERLYYYDGVNFTLLANEFPNSYAVADIAVDALGRAWVFAGDDMANVTSLDVYDNTGLLASYSMSFLSLNAYGSFFMDDVLYVGFGSQATAPNTIIPVEINGNTAQLGTSIPFSGFNFFDMASCPQVAPVISSVSELSINNIKLSPNPTEGMIKLPQNVGVTGFEVYALNGQQLIESTNTTEIDLTNLPNGMYIVKVMTENGSLNQKIIKR